MPCQMPTTRLAVQLTDWALATLRLGSVFQPPNSGNCGWTVNALEGFPIPSGALLVLEPLNASAPRAAVGVAALTGQTVVRQAAVGAALALGPGAEFAQCFDAALVRLPRAKRSDIEGWAAERIEQNRRFPFVFVEKARHGGVRVER